MIVVGNICDNRLDVVIVQEKMLRENLNTATRSEQMMTNTGTEHSVSGDTPSEGNACNTAGGARGA